MAARRGKWQFDWAGRHGTAWGTVNACLTTITVGCLGRSAAGIWTISTTQMVLAAVGIVVAGVVSVLLRAAVSRRRTPALTAVYKIGCWIGAGTWLAVYYQRPAIGWRDFTASVAGLAVAAAVAGLMASLADDKWEDDQRGALADGRQKALNKEAAAWEERLCRLTDIPGIRVPNIQHWDAGDGLTIEAILPAGKGLGWTRIRDVGDEIGNDLDLEAGCKIAVTMGVTRRAALIDVRTVPTKGVELPYPEDYSPLSILDPLPGAVGDDGSELGPELRERCMLIVGEAGSGKSNAGHNLGVSLARCTDALTWDIDFTRKLYRDLLRPFLKGQARQPAVDWVAWCPEEALLMVRAALRGHRARNAGYDDLMLQVNDDKIPISRDIPQVIIRGDEIAPITGAVTHHPTLREGLRDVLYEGRSAGFRTVLLGLRATDDVVTSDIQSQCHVTAVLRCGQDSELQWAFGSRAGLSVADMPHPGDGAIRLQSGATPILNHWRRVKPRQLVEVAIATDGRHPQMDDLTRQALDGRNPDGTPMKDLPPGDLDAYSQRWERYRAAHGGDHPAQPAPPQTALATTGAGSPAGASAPDPMQALADLHVSFDRMDAAAAAARARNTEDAVPADTAGAAPLSDADKATWDALIAEGFGPEEWADEPEPTIQAGDEPDVPDREEMLHQLLRQAGAGGIRPKELLRQLADRGVAIHRDTLHTWLTALRDKGLADSPSRGKWVARTKPDA